MATTTMGQPTRTNKNVWWAVAVVAAILIAIAMMVRSPRNADTTGAATSGVSDTNTTMQNNGAATGTSGADTGVAPGTATGSGATTAPGTTGSAPGTTTTPAPNQ